MAQEQALEEHAGPAKEPSHYGYSRGCRCDGCVEAGRQYHAKYYQRPGVRERRLADHRQRAYGLTSGEYDALFTRQGGVCAICGADSSAGSNGGRRSLAVDHHHESGVVRGLLCNTCNRAIGLFNDDLSRLKAAVAYLESKSG